ncbi:hypothetical protein [Synechococcus elongatus]|uniref:Uncharacterized protein n=2 Tax=Synechococcus elongatus TaxID=32046 RepID=A0AAN1UU68_SYNEL|nr:hypothetical protein [Synechococcus elongatus]AZB72251.1 hypothetical protein DOP62_05510 [Synechococcus elongatus PCC 11801]QFZ91950.1 hypothetical protein EKO22_05740 [Synechococcus elongatus PCC 11802]
MFLILLIVIALVMWALQLMRQAIDRREFSLMLAGFLVSSAAAALVAVYMLMNSYMGYLGYSGQQAIAPDWSDESLGWLTELNQPTSLDGSAQTKFWQEPLLSTAQ